MSECLICFTAITGDPDPIPNVVGCARCGRWQIIPAQNEQTWPLYDQLSNGGNEDRRRANLSHKVRRMGREDKHVGVPLDDLRTWSLDDHLPRPIQQTEDLILYVGDRLQTAVHQIVIDDLAMCAWLGTAITPRDPALGLRWLLAQETVKRFIIARPNNGKHIYRLTWDGWERYESLSYQENASRKIFMAMQFGDAELDHAVHNCFKPAVMTTGFELNLLTDGQGAGCIDDQMRVAIRTSRLVLADLTHRNPGTYWEGGFAEGLGKPVIYTCRKDVWDREKTHFDTNHLVTVVWNPNHLPKAAAELKATIRATLPDTAKLTD